MIRIVEHGRIRTQEAVCTKCGCRFEYTEPDVEKPGRLDPETTLTRCPDCGEVVFLTGPKAKDVRNGVLPAPLGNGSYPVVYKDSSFGACGTCCGRTSPGA